MVDHCHDKCGMEFPLWGECPLSSTSAVEVAVSHAARSLCARGCVWLPRRLAFLSNAALRSNIGVI